MSGSGRGQAEAVVGDGSDVAVRTFAKSELDEALAGEGEALGVAEDGAMPTDLGLRLAIYNSNLEVARSNPKLSPETGKDLGILNLATTLGQMLGPVLMSAITLSLGYAFAFPIAIAFALLGCVFIMLIRGVR